MSTALRSVLSKIEQFTAEASEDYARLVADLADDREVAADQVLAVCESSGHSLSDLQRDVERLLNRRSDAETVAGEPAAKASLADAGRHLAAETARAATELESRLAELELQKRQAMADHDNRVAVAQAAVDRAGAAVRECQAARERLTETAPADLRARVSELRTQRQFALSRVGDARKAVEREDSLIAKANESLQPADDSRQITDRYRVAAERAEARTNAERIIGAAQQRRARAAEALREATTELAALDDQLADAEAALLQP